MRSDAGLLGDVLVPCRIDVAWSQNDHAGCITV